MSDSTFRELPVIPAGPVVKGPTSADPIVGIDLGTTNSLVAIVVPDAAGNRTPLVIPSREGRNLVPSVVHFLKDGRAEIGEMARRERVRDSAHTVYSVKRLLGRGLEDLKDLVDRLPFDLDDSSSSNIKLRVDGRSYTPIEISAMILGELKAAAEEHLGRTVDDAVITVPAYFNDSQRQATRAAGRLAGFNVLRILNEPTAASLAYGLEKKKNGVIAVYDLGGGTFDVSILRLRDGIFEVIATNGDTQLGGDDIDHAIADWMRSKSGRADSDFAARDLRAALLEAAEKAKIALSTSDSVAVEIPLPGAPTLSAKLTRAELATLALPLLERTRKPVELALKDAGLTAGDLTDVVLVGGPTRLEVVKSFVERLFGRAPNASMNPDEVVAQGAAIQADILGGGNRDLLLLDVVPLSLGIETFGGAMSRLVPRNTTIPAMAKEQFTTYVEGQTKVAVNVYQGERELVKENRKLAEFVLTGVPPLPAGVARVEVTFLVDADGVLSVAAKELYSGVEASIEVKPTYGLTDAEVERMLADGLEHGEEDRTAARLIEARNGAQTVLTATEKALSEARELLAPEEARSIDGLVSALKSAIGSGSLEDVRAATESLNHGTHHLAELLLNETLRKNVKNRRVGDLV